MLDRVKSFALAVAYFAFAYSVLGFARGAGKSTGQQNSGMSVRLMQNGADTIALTADGVIIVAVGRFELNTATELDGDLKTLGAQPYGAALLIGAGVGIITSARTASPSLNKPKCNRV